MLALRCRQSKLSVTMPRDAKNRAEHERERAKRDRSGRSDWDLSSSPSGAREMLRVTKIAI